MLPHSASIRKFPASNKSPRLAAGAGGYMPATFFSILSK